MAEKTSGYDGEIDWEEEIIAADLAVLQEADVEACQRECAHPFPVREAVSRAGNRRTK